MTSPIDTIREACHRCGSQPSAETRSERHGQDWCNVCWDRVQPLPSAIRAALTELEHQQADAAVWHRRAHDARARAVAVETALAEANDQTERLKAVVRAAQLDKEAAERRANELHEMWTVAIDDAKAAHERADALADALRQIEGLETTARYRSQAAVVARAALDRHQEETK